MSQSAFDRYGGFAAVSRILLKDESSQTVYFGFADREALDDFLSTAEQHEAEHLVNGLARQVYQGLQRQFELERERRGGRLGR